MYHVSAQGVDEGMINVLKKKKKEYFLYFRAVVCLDSLASCVLVTSLLEQSIINWILLLLWTFSFIHCI